jgi:hypothetical protein
MDAEIEGLELEECMKNGCTFVLKFLKEEDDDLENDPDYEPDEADYDGKLYEYGSDYESDDAMSISADDEHEQEDRTEDDALYRDFLSKTIHRQPRVGEPVGAYLFSPETQRTDTLIPITSESLPEEYDPEDLEHIPGPGCRQAIAYPGASISLAEMRGCRTAQFLVHKTCAKGKWKPDGFNEDWEMGEDWFLSGVCDGMTSRDCGYPTVWPARGGVVVVAADNINFNVSHYFCLTALRSVGIGSAHSNPIETAWANRSKQHRHALTPVVLRHLRSPVKSAFRPGERRRPYEVAECRERL